MQRAHALKFKFTTKFKQNIFNQNTHSVPLLNDHTTTAQADLQLLTDGSAMDGTTNGGAGLIIMAGGAIIHRWQAPTGAQSSSFQAEKTAMQAAIAWLEEHEDWRKALLKRDCKPLVDAVGNSLAPEEGIRLAHAAVARLNAARCPRSPVGLRPLRPSRQ